MCVGLLICVSQIKCIVGKLRVRENPHDDQQFYQRQRVNGAVRHLQRARLLPQRDRRRGPVPGARDRRARVRRVRAVRAGPRAVPSGAQGVVRLGDDADPTGRDRHERGAQGLATGRQVELCVLRQWRWWWKEEEESECGILNEKARVANREDRKVDG